MIHAGGIVLAGGRSSRMGRPKAELDWHGVPLVVHVASVVRAAVSGPVVVVAAHGQPLPQLPDKVLTARDAEEGQGPLQGLAAGLPAAGDAAFVCAVDLPFLDAQVIERVLAALGDADAAVPVVHGARQPLAGAYRSRILPVIEARLRDGRRSLLGVLDEIETVDVPADDLADALRDLDEPADYSAALKRR